jgi:hypothetical protein
VSLSFVSDTTVDVGFSQPLFRDDEDGRRIPLQSEIQLAPRQSAGEVYLDVERSIAEWVDIYEERERTRGSGQEYEFIATYISPFDTGAIDCHRIVVGGTILEPVPDEDGGWRLIGNPNPNLLAGAIGSTGWQTMPTTRTYYLSRTQGIELPAVGDSVLRTAPRD